MSPASKFSRKENDISKGLGVSFAFHALVFSLFTLKTVFFDPEPINYQSAVRVDIVGLPDKLQPNQPAPEPAPKKEEAKPEPKPEVKPEPKVERKPEPKVAVEKPKLPDKTKDPEAVNLDKTKNKQKDALNKLKAMSALDKIKTDVEKESEKKMAGTGTGKTNTGKIKGNVLSPGTELTGLSKLQHEAYLGNLDKQIKQNWFLPEWLAKKSYRAQVRLKLDEYGKVISRDIVRSSGNPSYDEIVLETIDKSAPFPPPPEKFAAIVSVNGLIIGFPE